MHRKEFNPGIFHYFRRISLHHMTVVNLKIMHIFYLFNIKLYFKYIYYYNKPSTIIISITLLLHFNYIILLTSLFYFNNYFQYIFL